MLEQMRRSSQSLLIYLFFGIIIVVFVVNFGPQSAGGCDAQTPGSDYAAKVAGRTLSAADFRYGYLMYGGDQMQPQMARQRRLKETVMDRLIERELLAREAVRLGFDVSEAEVEDFLAESKMVALGFPQKVAAFQKDGHFDYETFRRFVQYQLGFTPRAFIEQQRRELLAHRVRALLVRSVAVSEEEVKADYVRREDQVNVEYLRFPARRHEGAVAPTVAEIEAHAKANEDKLKDLYEQRKFLYENAPQERRLRQIVIKVDADASADAEAAARKKAEAAAERVRKGATFDAVARGVSEDVRTRARGGLLGWRRKGATAMGAAVEDKVFAAKDGEVVGPEKGTDGYYVVTAEGTREGNIAFDAVRLELAEDRLRSEKAAALAKAEAEAALAKARAASGKSLKELFPAPKDQVGEPPPQAEETGWFTRRGAVVEGIGVSAELSKAVFALGEAQPFAGPIEVAGSYVVVKLKERKTPDMAAWEKEKGQLVEDAASLKGAEVMVDWTLQRCQEAKTRNEIQVNLNLLRYGDDPDGTVSYQPCAPPRL